MHPLAAPSPSPVVLVGVVDGGFDLATWVAIVAALVSAFAAWATWRAAVAAKRATEATMKSTEAAVIAAQAAQETAAIERASFQAAVEERVSRQASDVTIDIGAYAYNTYSRNVRVEVRNDSDYAVHSVEVDALIAGVPDATSVQRMQSLPPRSPQTFDLGVTGDVPMSATADENQGRVRFTDANGVRWERRSREAPVRLDHQVPGISG